MTYDGKNRVTLTRNILGQPYLLEQAGGACVEFSYLADGTKRYMVLDNSEGPQYYGSFIYRYDEAAGETYLESIAHPEGRFAATSYTSQHEPVYSNLHYVTDRVGSTVAIVDADADAYSDVEGTVLEGNGYTPFGERFAIGGFPKMPLNRFRFNGKEHLNRFSFSYIDYGARYYDPTIARWHRPDPMADKYPDTSPYAFCGNDPVNFVDPQGDTIRVYIEINQLGHVWISAGEGDEMVLYSYGRYAGTNKGAERASNTLSNGPGVLLRLTGERALEYNKEKESLSYDVYLITDITDQSVSSFFDSLFASSFSIPTTGKYANDDSAHIIDEYSLTDNNCTTKVSDALNCIGSSALSRTQSIPISSFGPYLYKETKKRPFIPIQMRFMLTNSCCNNPSITKQ